MQGFALLLTAMAGIEVLKYPYRREGQNQNEITYNLPIS